MWWHKIVLTVLVLLMININSNAWNAGSKNRALLAPEIYSFLKDDYNGERQNWDISSSSSGATYFANTLGLLRYDGENWSLYKTSNTLRAVYCSNDTIYVGGNGLMGYFLEKELHKGFQPLSKIGNDIWKIFRLNELMIFQSFDKIYHVNPDGLVGIERFKHGNTSFTFPVGEKIVYQISYGKLMEIVPNGPERVICDTPEISKFLVKYVSQLSADTFLIGTLENGLFTLSNNKLTPFNTPINDFIKTNQLNKIIRIDKNNYAFATMNGGLILGDLKGQITYVLNRSNGLSNNRVHAIYKQQDRFLWIATNNGISLIDLKNPVLFFNNQFIELGSFYDVAMLNHKYYVGTNHGLYKITPLKNQSSVFDIELIKGSEGQIWNLDVIDNNLWVGHNNGTYILDGSQLKQLSKVAGGYTMLQSQFSPDIVYQTSYFGVAVYKKTNQQWQQHYSITDINELTRDAVELRDGSLIITGAANTLFQIWPDNEKRKVTIKNLSLLPQMRHATWVRAFNIDGQVLISSNDTSFYYTADETIQPCPSAFNKASYISEIIDNHAFIRKNKQLSLYNLKTKTIVPLAYKLDNIEDDLIFRYERITQPTSGQIMLCLSDRIAYTQLNKLKNAQINRVTPSITRIQYSNDRTGKEGVFKAGETIPYQYNTLQFTFTAFRYGLKSSYEYILEGYNKNWQSRKDNHAVFQNLREGTYTFKVREKGGSLVNSLSFTIAPPPLRSNLAYAAYAALIIVLSIALRYSFNQTHKKKAYLRLQRERKRLNDLRLLKSQQQLGEEVKQLQEEVTSKSDKLANLLLQNNKKKEIIDKINGELKHIRENHRFVDGRQIDRLSKMIKVNFDEKKDWLVFEAAFSEAHTNFFKKLRTKHPNLTDLDLKLCAYLKVNLSSKELAPILKITTRSVDLKKYRLKKKLNLNKEQSLKQYIMDFDD